MTRVTNMRVEVVRYSSPQGPCMGCNLMYQIDGNPASSRVPWFVNNPAIEVARLERMLERTKQ